MKRSRKGQRGITLVGALVAGTLVAVGAVWCARELASQRRNQMDLRRSVRAGEYAIELVEMFRSWNTGTRMLAYLNAPAAPGAPAPLCSHVNLLDRVNGRILNEDPAAALPTEALGTTEGAMSSANRSYRVHVVDALTMTPDMNFCTRLPSALPPLGPNHRFLVTVTVSWVPPGMDLGSLKHVAVSALLPKP